MSTIVDPLLSPYRLGQHAFPGYWQYLLPPEVLEYRLPRERRATCSACPMIEARGFRPDYRCCTYLPLVPGFAIGLAMIEGRSKAQLERLIATGFMTPEGLHPSSLARFHAKRDDALGLYGKGETLCHLLDPDTGHCGIYAFRNGVCSTFFCIHDHGLVGEEFWASLRDLTCQLETALQQWALLQLGFDLEAYMRRLSEFAMDPLSTSLPKTRAWQPEVLDYLWSDWRQPRPDLFVECARLVSNHRHELFSIASRQRILEPTAFESALQSLIDGRVDPVIDAVAEPGAAPVVAHLELSRNLQAMLWNTPDGKTLLRLSPNVTIDQVKGVLRCDEGNDYWELNLSFDEATVLLYFSVPRSINRAQQECLEFKNLIDPTGFVAEYLACHVLEQMVG